MKNKRGILMKTTLGMVIAFVCLVFLYYFGYRIVEVYLGDREFEKAKSYSGQLEDLIKNLKEGEETDLMILGVKSEWAVVGWPFNPYWDFSGELIPEVCVSGGWEKCICFCSGFEEGNFGQLRDYEFKEYCDKKGICIDSSKFNSVIVSSDDDGEQNDPLLQIKQSAVEIKMKLNNGELRIWKNEEES